MPYRVKAAAAVVKIGTSERYLYRGAVVPQAASNIEHLLGIGLLEEFDLVLVDEPAGAESEDGAGAEEEQSDDGDHVEATPPPKAGQGASAEAWHAYAKALDVEVDAAAGRDAVIAAVEAAGKPTE